VAWLITLWRLPALFGCAKQRRATRRVPRPAFLTTTMHASLIRRQLGGLVPPKIAAPSLLVRAQRPSL
jgi:hypothetical protein